MTKAYEKIAEGLREALGYVEPEPNEKGLRISHDAYDNLSGALIDLRDRRSLDDAVVMRTIERVLSQLAEARRILCETEPA